MVKGADIHCLERAGLKWVGVFEARGKAAGAGQDLDSPQKGWCGFLSDLFHLKPCARLARF